MIKRFAAAALAAVMLVMLACPVSAEETVEYDVTELKELTREMYNMFVNLYTATLSFMWGEETGAPSDPIEYGKSDYYGDQYWFYTYYRRTDEYKVWKDLETAVYSKLSKDVGDRFIQNMTGFEHDGYAYAMMALWGAQNNMIYISDSGAGDFSNMPADFKVEGTTSDTVTASFEVRDGFDNMFGRYTLEYAKTDDGWRISGGTFVDTFFVPYRELESLAASVLKGTAPNTGSEIPALVICAAVSLAVITKRRLRA